MIKKAFRILVAITIVFVLTALPVSAQTLTPVCNDVHTSDISLLSPVCPACDHGGLIMRTIYTDWSGTGNYRVCSRNPNYTDAEQVRYYYYVWTCNNCGYQETSSTYAEYGWYCTH